MSFTHAFPQRSVIQGKAKKYLVNDPQVGVVPLDESLMDEIAETVFQSDRFPELRQAHQRGVKQAIESQVAAEVVLHYKRIKMRQLHPTVQQLNALL
jgi:hypothetical protein